MLFPFSFLTQPKTSPGPVTTDDELERLLKKPMRGADASEFERLVKRGRQSDFEKLLARPYRPKPTPRIPVGRVLGRVLRGASGIGAVIGEILTPNPLGAGDVSKEEMKARAPAPPTEPKMKPPEPPEPDPPKPRTRARVPPNPSAEEISGIYNPQPSTLPLPPDERGKNNKQTAFPDLGSTGLPIPRPMPRRGRQPQPRRSNWTLSSSLPLQPLAGISPLPSTPVRTASLPTSRSTLPTSSLLPSSASVLPSLSPMPASRPLTASNTGGVECRCDDGRRGKRPRPSDKIAKVTLYDRRMSQNSLDNLNRGRKPGR